MMAQRDRRARWVAAALAMMGCTLGVAQTQNHASVSVAPFSAGANGTPPSPWRVVGLPQSSKPVTRFEVTAPPPPLSAGNGNGTSNGTEKGGENGHTGGGATPANGHAAATQGLRVLKVEADRSYGNLVHALPQPFTTPPPGTRLRWRWRLDEPLRNADLHFRNGDDSPLKVCAMFDMPDENLGFMDRQVLRMLRARSGEDVPAATLCYVWDHTLPVGTLVRNAYTARIRMLVVSSGDRQLGQWISHDRDLVADFRRAFGRESDTVPPLEGLLVGADSDNTGGHSLGYVGDVTLGR